MLAVYNIGGMINDKRYFPTEYTAQKTNFLQNLDQELPMNNEISWYNRGGFFGIEKG
jgi:hypothetical protein